MNYYVNFKFTPVRVNVRVYSTWGFCTVKEDDNQWITLIYCEQHLRLNIHTTNFQLLQFRSQHGKTWTLNGVTSERILRKKKKTSKISNITLTILPFSPQNAFTKNPTLSTLQSTCLDETIRWSLKWLILTQKRKL